jgi:hypothetical protein
MGGLRSAMMAVVCAAVAVGCVDAEVEPVEQAEANLDLAPERSFADLREARLIGPDCLRFAMTFAPRSDNEVDATGVCFTASGRERIAFTVVGSRLEILELQKQVFDQAATQSGVLPDLSISMGGSFTIGPGTPPCCSPGPGGGDRLLNYARVLSRVVASMLHPTATIVTVGGQ